MQQYIISVFKTPSDERTRHDFEAVKYIMKGLRVVNRQIDNSDVNERRSNELLFRVFKKFELVLFMKDDIIFKQGEFGHHMFLILDGSVQVTVSRGLDAAGEFMPKKGKVYAPVFKSNTAAGGQDDSKDGARIDWSSQILANVLNTGDAFGELALSVTTKRTATCLAMENTHVIRLDKETFLRVLDAEVSENKYMFTTLDRNFGYLRFVHSSELVGKIEKMTCRMNQVLIDFNKVPEYIYIVRSGSVKVATL